MRRARTTTAGALPEAVLDTLVHGWVISRHDRPASYDWMAAYDVPHDGWPALYQEHRLLVEAEARRRGLPRSWAAEQFTEAK